MSCKVNLPAFFIIFSPFSVSWQHSHRWSFSLIWRTGSNRWRTAWTRRKKKSSRPAVQLRSLKSCRISRYLNRLCFHFSLCIYFNWLYLKGYFSASLYFELTQPIHQFVWQSTSEHLKFIRCFFLERVHFTVLSSIWLLFFLLLCQWHLWITSCSKSTII